GNFYELYKDDAVKASVILAWQLSEKILPLEKDPIKMLSFPDFELDKHLPKLVRSGERVAICDSLQSMLQKKPETDKKQSQKQTEQEVNNPNQETMAKKKKEQAKQEEPTQTMKTTVEEKPAKEKKAEAKSEQSPEQKTEVKKERKPREPQMVTANGEKVSHGHAFQSTTNPDDWYFTAKINGVQLKPQKMDAADLAAYQKKEMTVPQLMERYYPTKLMPKVSEEDFRMPKELAGPDGAITIDKFNVYKEKDEQRPDFGKYKFYAQMGDTKMSAVASKEDLNAYF
ncbi:DNA mismatch repair protein mutS, partial [gut metagenome]